MLRAAWFALARRSSVWAPALGGEKAIEDAAHTLREDLDQVGAKIGVATPRTGQQCAQPDQSSHCSDAQCCCRFKVFALECEGQHYCRCGYPIRRYKFYDMSPAKQALLPIIVVLAAIGLLHVLMAPAMNWGGRPPACDGIILACPEGE